MSVCIEVSYDNTKYIGPDLRCIMHTHFAERCKIPRNVEILVVRQALLDCSSCGLKWRVPRQSYQECPNSPTPWMQPSWHGWALQRGKHSWSYRSSHSNSRNGGLGPLQGGSMAKTKCVFKLDFSTIEVSLEWPRATEVTMSLVIMGCLIRFLVLKSLLFFCEGTWKCEGREMKTCNTFLSNKNFFDWFKNINSYKLVTI